MVGRCGFDPLPKGRVLRTRCRSHRLSLPDKLEPHSGTDPESAHYQRAEVTLCQRGVAESRVIETHTLRCPLASNVCREPSRLTFQIGGG
jgi:hypothetical protein